MKILGIVVARRGSERLPGKVLRELAGEPMLLKVLARASHSTRLNDLVVALPDNKADDSIESLCLSSGYYCFRGSEYDLLDRVYRTAIAYGADIIVPLRASCPLIDGQLVDQVVEKLLESKDADWCTNRLPKHSYPEGLEIDAIRIETLRRAWHEDSHPGPRQHLESFLIRRVDLFNTASVSHTHDLSHVPWQVLTLPDLDRVRAIFEKLGNNTFSWHEALAVWETIADDYSPAEPIPNSYWHTRESS
ncbi:MAG: hypothetical protein IPP40_11110 [bacterium]|nr:hypothetical protein [bacterium]